MELSTIQQHGKRLSKFASVCAVYDICLRIIRGHKQQIIYLIRVLTVGLMAAYLGLSVNHSFEGSIPLLTAAGLAIIYIGGVLVKDACGKHIELLYNGLEGRLAKFRRHVKRLTYIAIAGAIVIFLAVDVGMSHPRNLMSLCGIAFYILVSWLASNAPTKVEWSTVFTGMVAQLVMALVVLRWESGSAAIEWISDKLIVFLRFGNDGARFLFGASFAEHGFAMALSPAILWFAAITQLLLHFGIIQVIAKVLGGALYFFIGTSPVEAFVAIVNIFLGPASAVLMVQSMLPDLTESQIHSFMVCGLASITAGLFPVFQSFGVPARHLLSASCMSAPAALVLSKIIYPETETRTDNKVKLTKPGGSSVLVKFYRGALDSVELVTNILVVLIAFISILAYINSVVTWFGDRAGFHQLTMEKILGCMFMPAVFLMGVAWEDCGLVGQLIGTKTIVNEFVAYVDLGVLIDNRKQGLQPSISERSEVIVAYALCGFSNLGTIGMQVAMFSAMIPDKKGAINQMALRSLIAGSFACFMTACVAGLLAT